jgi:ABC-type nitrate/sulfonate/bicarbonate transport system substrate-binding protein
MRRTLLIGVAVIASVAGYARASAQEAGKDIYTMSRAAISRAPADWPVFVAEQKGFFADEKLKVDNLYVSPANITGSLIGGAFDVALVPAYQLVLSVQKGAGIVAVGQGLDPAPYFLMVPATIKTFADLKGKTIAAATRGDVYTYVLRDVLRKGGLDPDKDVTFIYGNNSNQRMAALLNGAISAGLQLPPETGMLADRGFHSLAFFPDYYRRLTLSLIAARRDWVANNADHLRAYLRAIAAANVWLDSPANRQEATAILMKNTHTSETAAAEAYRVFVQEIGNYPKDACIQPEGMEVLISKLEQSGDVHGKPPATKFIDRQWCPK